MKQNKSCKQTLESAQNGLEIMLSNILKIASLKFSVKTSDNYHKHTIIIWVYLACK